MRLTVAVALCALSSMCLAADPVKASIRKTTSIPAESLGAALQTLASTYDFQVLYRTETVKDLKTRGATGTFTPQEALGAVLAGTGLAYKYVDEKTVTIVPTSTATPAQGSAPQTDSQKEDGKNSSQNFLVAQVDQGKASNDQPLEKQGQSPKKSGDQKDQLQEVVVTGTHIRGVQPSSPIVVLTQSDIVSSGQTDLGEALRSQTWSFAGGQNPGVNVASGGAISNQNLTGASSPNLRGLGPDATLTLLDGRRLSYDGFFQATDVSTIPLAAVDSVQVLLDGASAIYGSDAVAGVVNVNLKHDFQGVEASARYGVATDGGGEQRQFDLVGGNRWSTGGFIVALNYESDGEIEDNQRSYFSYVLPDNYLIQPVEQYNALLSGHQDITSYLHADLDAVYAYRSTPFFQNLGIYGISGATTKVTTFAVSPTLKLDLPGTWDLTLNGVGSQDNDHSTESSGTAIGQPLILLASPCYCNSLQSVEADASGPLFSLPAGSVGAAIGAGSRWEHIFVGDPLDPSADIEGSRNSWYSFGELNVPVVAPDQHVPLVKRLSLDTALRFEDYSDFGHVVTPKVGLSWSLTDEISVKGTWGKSFKAPTLGQVYEPYVAYLYAGPSLGLPTPNSTAILTYGGDRNLKPERATTNTTGITYQPATLSGLKIEVNYFNIDYKQRVVQPVNDTFSAFTDPVDAAFVTYAPTPAQLNALLQSTTGGLMNYSGSTYNPANVAGVVYDQYTNAARENYDGVDMNTSYSTGLFDGTVTGLASVSWLEGKEQTTPASPLLDTVGTIYNPPHWRARAGIHWKDDRLDSAIYVNYIGGEVNTLSTPYVQVGSQTTVDLSLGYKIPELSPMLRDTNIRFSVSNLFDQKPPYVNQGANYVPNFDSTNYSALGRFVGLTLSKHW